MRAICQQALAGLLIVAAALPGVAAEAADKPVEPDAAMAVITGFSDGLESFHGLFTQQVYEENGRLIESSSGTMALTVPDLLSWRYGEPFEQWIIADGDKIWTWDVDLEQVTVKDQVSAAGDSPLYLLMSPQRLADNYRLIDRGKQDQLATVALIPLEPRADFEWVELGFHDQMLARLVIQDAFGQRTVIALEATRRNQPVPAETFTFVPPAGVDVLGEAEISLEGLADPN